jgi:hypothetical protein
VLTLLYGRGSDLDIIVGVDMRISDVQEGGAATCQR